MGKAALAGLLISSLAAAAPAPLPGPAIELPTPPTPPRPFRFPIWAALAATGVTLSALMGGTVLTVDAIEQRRAAAEASSVSLMRTLDVQNRSQVGAAFLVVGLVSTLATLVIAGLTAWRD